MRFVGWRVIGWEELVANEIEENAKSRRRLGIESNMLLDNVHCPCGIFEKIAAGHDCNGRSNGGGSESASSASSA